MGEYLLKILTDILFYLAIFIPLIVNGAMPVRIVLAAVPVVWAVWIKMNWKTKDFMEALRENFFFQVKLLIFISFRVTVSLFSFILLNLTFFSTDERQ